VGPTKITDHLCYNFQTDFYHYRSQSPIANQIANQKRKSKCPFSNPPLPQKRIQNQQGKPSRPKRESLPRQNLRRMPTSRHRATHLVGSPLRRTQTGCGRHRPRIFRHHHLAWVLFPPTAPLSSAARSFSFRNFRLGHLHPAHRLARLWLVARLPQDRTHPAAFPERAIGSTILFFWLLTVLHSFVATAETAEAVALTGAGGGYFGGLAQRFLWGAFGSLGAFIALIAWLIIGIAVMLEKPVAEFSSGSPR
jgi:hypothetical protein